MDFIATKHPVLNRGVAPDSFLTEIIAWAIDAPDVLFEPNDAKDIYSLIAPVLGEFPKNLEYRRAQMLEAMRVHAGFESSWNWNEGVDTTNARSMSRVDGQETGIFQVSYDSAELSPDLNTFLEECGIDNVNTFIAQMKLNHRLCLGYYARLVRVNIRWAGPLLTGRILPWLSKDACDEFYNSIVGKPANVH